MVEQKTLYNVNINNSRVEQFETLEQAQDYINKQIKPYITKSIYEYDNECECWDEIIEENYKAK